MKFSLSQRIGIILAVLWLPTGFLLGNKYGVHEGDWATAMLDHCRAQSSDWATCLAKFNHDYYVRSLRSHWWSGGIVAVVPVFLVWFLAFIYLRIFRRGKAGFNQSP